MVDKILTDIKLLRTISKDTTLEECTNLDIFNRLEATLNASIVPGIGLSAIQIGIPIRAFILKAQGIWESQRVDIFNPVIEEQCNLVTGIKEGCLSLPGINVTTKRFLELTLRYNGGTRAVFTDLEAVIVAHEFDHCDGLLCTDRQCVIEKALKIGRNDKCPICFEKGIVIKYKKCIAHFIS
jgi:peptide deformylase